MTANQDHPESQGAWTLDLAGITSLHEWLATWGPEGSPTWNDATGLTVPIQKSTLAGLLDLAENYLRLRAKIREAYRPGDDLGT